MKRNVYAIIDGHAGSCGKGKVIGQYALEKNIDAAITNCMPNAGHTFVSNGKKRVFCNIPVSSVNENTELFIGPGSVIDMNSLEREYEENKDILEGREIIVHPLVPLIKEEHILREKQEIKTGSTFKGCCCCQTEKMMRGKDNIFFKEYKNIKATDDYYKRLQYHLKNSDYVLLEGAQGCDLDINHSRHYPNTTSRQVSVAQMLADTGISPLHFKEAIMVIRPFPIRISNEIFDGSEIYSGDYGKKNHELSWEQINVASYLGQYPTVITDEDIEEYKDVANDLTEHTTVTKKVRRIFDIDLELLKRNIEINTPAEIYLNFFEQLDSSYTNIHGEYTGSDGVYIDKYRREYLSWLEEEIGVPITMLGTGPDLEHYIDRRQFVKKIR